MPPKVIDIGWSVRDGSVAFFYLLRDTNKIGRACSTALETSLSRKKNRTPSLSARKFRFCLETVDIYWLFVVTKIVLRQTKKTVSMPYSAVSKETVHPRQQKPSGLAGPGVLEDENLFMRQKRFKCNNIPTSQPFSLQSDGVLLMGFCQHARSH